MQAATPPDDTSAPGIGSESDVGTSYRSFRAAVKSISLAAAESRTHRECVVAECLSQMRDFLDVAGGWTLWLDDEQFALNGVRLPFSADDFELRSIFFRGGLRCVHIDPTVSEQEVRTLLDAIGGFGSGRDLTSVGTLATRLQDARFLGISISGRPRQRSASKDAAAPSRPHHIWEGSWSDEVENELTRVLPHETSVAILRDLRDSTTFATPYRGKAVALLATLVQDLAHASRFDALAETLELAAAPGALGQEELNALHETVADCCTDTFVRDLVVKLPDTAPVLVKLTGLLAETLVPLLLRECARQENPALNETLEELARKRSSLFLSILGMAPLSLQETAFSLLEKVGHAFSRTLLDVLADSDAESLRTRAIRQLTERYPEHLAAERAAALLADPCEQVRIVVLRFLGKNSEPETLDTLLAWFREHDAELSFAERRCAFESIADTGGERALPVLREWIDARRLFGLGGPDDNRLCAIHALGRIPGTAAHELLEELRESRNSAVREAARRASKDRS